MSSDGEAREKRLQDLAERWVIAEAELIVRVAALHEMCEEIRRKRGLPPSSGVSR